MKYENYIGFQEQFLVTKDLNLYQNLWKISQKY